MMIVGWPLSFLLQGQICVSKDLYGEKVEKHIFFFNMYLRLMANTLYSVWLK